MRYALHLTSGSENEQENRGLPLFPEEAERVSGDALNRIQPVTA
jgi:hypothetical protein